MLKESSVNRTLLATLNRAVHNVVLPVAGCIQVGGPIGGGPHALRPLSQLLRQRGAAAHQSDSRNGIPDPIGEDIIVWIGRGYRSEERRVGKEC